MRVWDTEFLLKHADVTPVTDGLVLWLDGQDVFYGDQRYGDTEPAIYTASHMFERVNSARVDFAMAGASGTCLRQDSLVLVTVLLSGGSSTSRQDGAIATALNGIKTIEIVMAGGLFPTYAANSIVTFSNGMVKYGNATVSGSSPSVDSGDFMFFSSGGANVISRNGVTLASASGSEIVADNVTRIICLRSGKQLGCVRFYNRVLSADEIQQNLQYEQSIGRVSV